MNIYYLCPDLPQPSGGVRRLYSHVEILRQEGYPAYILHFKKGFQITWFTSDVPVVFLNDNIQWNPSDVLVFPEGFSTIIKKFKSTPFRKIIIALSHSYIFPQLPKGENWKDYGIETVITPSQIIKEFVSWSMDIKNIYLIGTSIDHNLFTFNNENKTLQIAYIPRKDSSAEIIEKVFKSRKSIEINFVKIENTSIEEYSDILKQSSIYLTTSAHEGINRSVIEAMACGCICIGYDGIGAKEYIQANGKKQNFILVENMNYIELAKKIEETYVRIENNDPKISLIRNNAVDTAVKFDNKIEKESLINFWKSFL